MPFIEIYHSIGDKFTWAAIIDILIVSVLIYQLLLLIRGTRAVQMAVGVGLLVLFFYATRWLQLETVQWIVTNILPYFVFGIIVLFAVEIRRALATIGQNPLIRRFSKTPFGESYDEIVLAATTLSSQRIGGLIVIEREIGLKNYIESGVNIDAALSYDLLVTIFSPGAPLHDGAVIIQKDRITAAACFLPLTVDPRLSKELGTRHRAAIGVTEESDAVVVVVSEETGIISIVVGGKIVRNLDGEGLRKQLEMVIEGRLRTRAVASYSGVAEVK
jgi:diadenylate cyclase